MIEANGGFVYKLASREVAALDPYKFMALIGRRVIHPGGLAIMGRVAAGPGRVRKMVWLMPRMANAVPYVGYILVAGCKPAVSR